MVKDDIAINNLFICCNVFWRPRHKSGQCWTFVFKYIYFSLYSCIDVLIELENRWSPACVSSVCGSSFNTLLPPAIFDSGSLGNFVAMHCYFVYSSETVTISLTATESDFLNSVSSFKTWKKKKKKKKTKIVINTEPWKRHFLSFSYKLLTRFNNIITRLNDLLCRKHKLIILFKRHK